MAARGCFCTLCCHVCTLIWARVQLQNRPPLRIVWRFRVGRFELHLMRNPLSINSAGTSFSGLLLYYYWTYYCGSGSCWIKIIQNHAEPLHHSSSTTHDPTKGIHFPRILHTWALAVDSNTRKELGRERGKGSFLVTLNCANEIRSVTRLLLKVNDGQEVGGGEGGKNKQHVSTEQVCQVGQVSDTFLQG